MADTPEKDFYRGLAPGRNEHRVVDYSPTRLTGDLAANETIAGTASASEKIPVHGLSKIRVTYKITQTAIAETVTIIPYLADGTTVGVVGGATDSAAVSGIETKQDLDLYGAEYVEIKVTNDHASNVLTVNYVEVQGL